MSKNVITHLVFAYSSLELPGWAVLVSDKPGVVLTSPTLPGRLASAPVSDFPLISNPIHYLSHLNPLKPHTARIYMCVAHGGAMRREPPQRSEDIESIAALAVIIPLTAKPVFYGLSANTVIWFEKSLFDAVLQAWFK